MLMLPLHAGQRIRCVTGCRIRVSVFTWTWLAGGSSLVRHCYRPHNMTWRGWDEAEEFNKPSKSGKTSKVFLLLNLTMWFLQECSVLYVLDFLWMFRSWASNTHCTERSCSWLCRPSAQRRRTVRESWTTIGWRVSTSRRSKTWTKLSVFCWSSDDDSSSWPFLLWIKLDCQLDVLLLKLCSFPFLSGWLDDIGLPQYKTQFDEGRVDGRMLHYMTVVSFNETHALPPQILWISRSGLSSAILH